MVHPTFVPGTVVDGGQDWLKYTLDAGGEWVDSVADENDGGDDGMATD